MPKLKLTLSIWDYDRTRALADGTVRPDGIELNVLELPVEETFFRMARNREFDVAAVWMMPPALLLVFGPPGRIVAMVPVKAPGRNATNSMRTDSRYGELESAQSTSGDPTTTKWNPASPCVYAVHGTFSSDTTCMKAFGADRPGPTQPKSG